MTTIYYDHKADAELMRRKQVAVIGYGSQGHAHALNLRDSGVQVVIGLEPNSKSRERARSDGFKVLSPEEAVEVGEVISILIPDTSQPELYRSAIEPKLADGKTLLFAHGFNIYFGTIVPPANVNVVMIAPKSPGYRVREVFVEGGGTPALMAIQNDATKNAKALALSYAKALGATRAGVIETTFREETETDLFGEQAVLCGGMSALIKAGFDILVEAGYQPEIAYYECLHELKLIVDLVYQGGLNYMRHSISDTAEYGDYTGGPQVITDDTRKTMRNMLAEIQQGNFARKWIAENEAGRPWFSTTRTSEQEHQIEKVGARLRAMMPFVNPVTVTSEGLSGKGNENSKKAEMLSVTKTRSSN